MPDADTSGRLARDFALMEQTVREAGALGLAMFRTELRKWIKGESSPVSEADIALNDLIEKRLRSATPDYGWLSEESADDDARLGKRLTWIIDPIDGTRSYLAGREDWCVCVALVEDHRPVMAAVFAPSTDEFFLAMRGQGTTCNGRPVQAIGNRSRFRPRGRPQAPGGAPDPSTAGPGVASADWLAGAAALLDRQWPAGCSLCRRAEPGLGSGGCGFDRA